MLPELGLKWFIFSCPLRSSLHGNPAAHATLSVVHLLCL